MKWKDLRGEIAAHIEEKALELIESGVPQEEAWNRARREFGNTTLVIESSREVWTWTWLEYLWQDLVYARRMFAKHAGFTAIAVLSLALGVGANSAMFSFADALLLRPLPVPRAGDLLNAGYTSASETVQSPKMSYPDYRDFLDRSRSFSALTAFNLSRVRFAKQRGGPVQVRTGIIASAGFFATMQVQPELGRGFLPSEDQVPGRDAVIVLSHAFWEQAFQSDPQVLGRAVRLNGVDFAVIGVLPADFTGPDLFLRPEFYVPLMMWPRLNGPGPSPLEQRGLGVLDVKGRLKEGVTVEQARAESAGIGRVLAEQYPETNRNHAMGIRTELQRRVDESIPIVAILAMMLLLAGLVLLVACANVAGLLTSRAPARAREMSLRLAIGAKRGRLVRQLLTESLILALLGAAGGIGVGYAGVRLMKQLTIVTDVPVALSFRLDERVLFFSLAVAMGSVFLFGLGPALRTARADLAGSLRMGNTPSSRPRSWTRNALVVGQVALSMVLLTVATLMYQSFQCDLLAGPGFRTGHVLIAGFDPSLVNYTAAQERNLYKNLRAGAKDLAGVRSASLASMVPANYGYESMTIAPEQYQLPEGEQSVSILASRVDENYFGTLGIPIVRGRAFAAGDDARSPMVAVVNEAAAAYYWPGQDPLGKRIRLTAGAGAWLEVVGVAKTGKYRFLMERPTRFLYVPYAQHPRSQMILLLESEGDPTSLTGPLHELVRRLDPDLPIYGVRTLQETFETGAVSPNLLIIRLEAAMGAMGVLLALTGLYGLMAYSVSARRREIGIRLAIGAHKNNVLGMVMRQGFALAGVGTLTGLALSAVAGRVLVAAFPDTRNSIAAYFIVVPAVFGVTMLAALVPARRAAKVDPVAVLRQD